jgi:hypothetical protein
MCLASLAESSGDVMTLEEAYTMEIQFDSKAALVEWANDQTAGAIVAF